MAILPWKHEYRKYFHNIGYLIYKFSEIQSKLSIKNITVSCSSASAKIFTSVLLMILLKSEKKKVSFQLRLNNLFPQIHILLYKNHWI